MKRHMSQGRSTLDRFFDTIREHGGASMQYLLEDVPSSDGLTTHKQFFDVVSGEKSEAKYQILNHCLVLFVYKWRKKDGGLYEPSTLTQFSKHLFKSFSDHGIHYNPEMDFLEEGEFALILQKMWNEHHNINRDYGTRCKKAAIDLEADFKITMSVYEKKLRPFELVHHMIAAWIYVLGHFFGLCGQKEVANLCWDQVSLNTYTSRPDMGLEYVKVKLSDGDKAHKLLLKKPTIDRKLLDGIPVCKIPNYPLCPVKLYKK